MVVDELEGEKSNDKGETSEHERMKHGEVGRCKRVE